jgi:hypothetical protein
VQQDHLGEFSVADGLLPLKSGFNLQLCLSVLGCCDFSNATSSIRAADNGATENCDY